MIEFLIDKGANVNAPGRDGSTPLHFSAEGGHEEASDSLLDHGADITLANERGTGQSSLSILIYVGLT